MREQLEYFIKLNLKNPVEKEIKEILEVFHEQSYKKGEYFKQNNQVCKSIGFLVEGNLRFYAIKKNGNEITGRIVNKNSIITDLISLRTKEFSPICIQAIEPTKMLVASIEDVEKLQETNLTLNRIIREHMADRVVDMGKLYLLFLTGTAKERYYYIIEKNPKLLKSIPLRFIATMIGITPTQLSRIRNKKESK